jgi:hypothetical protein
MNRTIRPKLALLVTANHSSFIDAILPFAERSLIGFTSAMPAVS